METAENGPRVKRARSKSGAESSLAVAMDGGSPAAWSRTMLKSQAGLVHEYIMMLVLERRNIRFKEYLTQCALEEKIADVVFDSNDDEECRQEKLQLLHEYNEMLEKASQLPPKSLESVEHPLAEAIPEISDASDLNVHDDFSISLDPEFGECAHGLDEILSELQPEIDDY